LNISRPNAELSGLYIVALKQWAMTFGETARGEMEDLQSEHSLRGLELPKNAETDLALKVMVARMTAAVEEMKKDPERERRINRELADDIIAEIEEAQAGAAN
jgi:hypothetical protein